MGFWKYSQKSNKHKILCFFLIWFKPHMKVGWIVIQIWFLQMCLSLESQKYSYYIQKEFAFPFIEFFLCYREALHRARHGAYLEIKIMHLRFSWICYESLIKKCGCACVIIKATYANKLVMCECTIWFDHLQIMTVCLERSNLRKKNWFACSLNIANESVDPVHKTGLN